MKEYTLRSTYTGRSSRLRRAADIALVILISAFLVFVLFRFMLVPKEVGLSLVGGVEEGELVLVDRVSKYVLDYGIGDILDTGSGFLRLAARGGDTYIVRNGHAYLNGAYLDESAYSAGWEDGIFIVLTVPEGSLLLLPDSREGLSSLDDFVLPASEVGGELRFRLLPFNKLNLYL